MRWAAPVAAAAVPAVLDTGVDAYRAFIEAKVCVAVDYGFEVDPERINKALKEFSRAIVAWLLKGGRRALFASFGLHKTVTQLEAVRIASEHLGGRGLIVAPLGVRQEFFRDAVERLGWAEAPKFVRSIQECGPTGVYIANYETVRDGKLDPREFCAASLDEASVLRGFGGTKTFREFMRLFAGIPFKFVATATPSPNEYIELLAYAAFLEIMDVGQAKTRFFKRDSDKADQLTVHPHKEREFWLWVASWGLFVQKPSDLGYSDAGYDLPPLEIHWHEIAADHSNAGAERDGQGRLFKNAALSLIDASREKRDSLPGRIGKLLEIRAEAPDAHRIIWHDLERERVAIEHAIPSCKTVWGSQDFDEREDRILDFSNGKFQELATKPVIAGSGTNLQRFCWWAVYLGIGFKFNDFFQSIHRLQRFGQTHAVRIDLIYTTAEREVRRRLEGKWQRHKELVAKMTEIIREYGLARTGMAAELARSMGVERIEVVGERYSCVNNDCVAETRRMGENSVDLIVTSIPFSTQYEYTPSYLDFGHTDDNGHFFRQLDFLTVELLRILKPGRVAAIHVKDRIVPGGLTGLGFQTVQPFSDETVAHFRRHGFAFLARKTVGTDVVRENNQTYRLGWTEQCKDGSRMGAGMPEYVLLFRKPPSDSSNGYADVPVVKDKKKWDPEANDGKGAWQNPEGYSRARWQLDANGVARSSGDRLLAPEDLIGLPADQVYRLWKQHALDQIYDFEHHVRIGESLEVRGALPPTFMLLPPHSRDPDIWTDITRMLTLNGQQSAKGQEMHLCPLQFDVVDRLIQQHSQRDELVFDPFGGLMTVPYRALKLGRRGAGVELNPGYFLDGVAYVEAMAREISVPSLFDLLDEVAA
ncbi:MAG: hypothetical protein JWO51_178 [Rhodospirillales bacterium]|nr:hypothetical protein [Rhodospirillales bacterium]